MRFLFSFFGLLFIFPHYLSSQITQTIRGNVQDKISQTPIPGAIVQLTSVSYSHVTITNAEGIFEFRNIPIGKISLKITYLGYKETELHHIQLNAGKELVLNLQLEEDLKTMDEVVVTSKVEKNKPLNEMSTVSTRAFSVEETQKFAAAVNDPGRMATSFAGVVSAGDGGNTISIRGNSPNGLLWRMEGVEIPNPSHFSSVGTSGGGISILSAQLLNNSDFSTGAFAAEYGNALSGVFDLKLRRGNDQKREYTVQLGLLGLDVSSEGPFKKGYGGSYLINYRYSTLNLLAKVGVPLGDAITNFQDLSFNVFLPTKRLGNFTVFGFGGLSYQLNEAKKDSSIWMDDDFYRMSTKFKSNTGVAGITNTKLFKNQSYLKTVMLFAGVENGNEVNELQNNLKTFNKLLLEAYLQNRLTLSSTYTKKLNARSNIRLGGIVNQLNFRLTKKTAFATKDLTTTIDRNGNTNTLQGFFQWNYRLNEKLTTNVGAHYMHLLLNNTLSFEPRASIKYSLHPKYNVFAGYGLHSQIQPIGIYFSEATTMEGEKYLPNKNLDLSKAHHFIIGQDWNLTNYSHIKTEVYYQHLFNVPISTNINNTYSILNSIDGFYTNSLINKGLGKNCGVELTLERFLHNSFYYLVSGSLYDSKYQASNGKWYNTQFNTNYALTITMGKEWQLSEKRKNRIIGLNFKSVYVGGYRNTPIDLELSKEKREAVLIDNRAFENRNPDYFRLDIRVSLKRNYKRVTSTLALDIQNTTNHQNIGGQYFNVHSGTIKYWYQTPLIPILSYKLEF